VHGRRFPPKGSAWPSSHWSMSDVRPPFFIDPLLTESPACINLVNATCMPCFRGGPAYIQVTQTRRADCRSTSSGRSDAIGTLTRQNLKKRSKGPGLLWQPIPLHGDTAKRKEYPTGTDPTDRLPGQTHSLLRHNIQDSKLHEI
jgi:hypothetical protein